MIREILSGPGTSLDKVHAIASAGIKALLKSPAVIQRVEHPVAEDNERNHRDKRRDIAESAALEIVRPRVHWRVQAIKLEFLRLILAQVRRPPVGKGAG